MSWIPIELYKHGVIKIGDFKLSSGLSSPFYIDMRKIYSYPELAKRIVLEFLRELPLDDIEVFVGVESAGIPLAAYMSCLSGKPMAYVRKEKKNYGSGSIVEGDVASKRVAVVDDVITTGNSILKAVINLMESGAIPIKVAVLVDREQGAEKLLSKYGIKLYSLLKARDLFKSLYIANMINEKEYTLVVNYLEMFK